MGSDGPPSSRPPGAVDLREDEAQLRANMTILGDRNSDNISTGAAKRQHISLTARVVSGRGDADRRRALDAINEDMEFATFARQPWRFGRRAGWSTGLRTT
jgi:hypothetical protein